MKHLLKLGDLTPEEILSILNLADQLKYEQKHGIPHPHLAGKTMGMILYQVSVRSRVSFEVAMHQLGGYPLILTADDLKFGRGQPLCDTARTLSRYLDGLLIRSTNQTEIEDYAEYGSVPVINAMSDFAHPCQVLADLMTIREYKGKLDDLKLCFIGDGNNMANSLIAGGLKVGMRVTVATPEGLEPSQPVLDFAAQYGDRFQLTNNAAEAIRDADVVATDAWTDVGGEKEAAACRPVFEDYQLNGTLMVNAAPDAMVLHALPAYRDEEITAKVFEDHAGEIFDEAENRLHAQKAVLVKLLGKEH